jgi:hypothetical protein
MMPADRSDAACTVAGVRSPSCILSVMVLRNSHQTRFGAAPSMIEIFDLGEPCVTPIRQLPHPYCVFDRIRGGRPRSSSAPRLRAAGARGDSWYGLGILPENQRNHGSISQIDNPK